MACKFDKCKNPGKHTWGRNAVDSMLHMQCQGGTGQIDIRSVLLAVAFSNSTTLQLP